MYPPLAPPQDACIDTPAKKGFLSELHGEELLLIGLVLLLMTERTEPDILLVMALVYVLFAK